MLRVIRIGNGAGFWGDSLSAPRRLVQGATLNYLTLEYLAELTLSILAHQRAKNPELGYVADLLTVLQDIAPTWREQPGLKIVTNGGGMNPLAAGRAAAKLLKEAGLGDRRIGVVTGDDLLPRLDELLASGEELRHLETGEPFSTIRSKVASANAYLGAGGIAQALDEGANLVITGRVADASLTVGPAVHEFGWGWEQWPQLAAVTVAGHLIECGAQVTGGMFADWQPELNLTEVGYPIAEVSEDGGIVITKPAGTGGLVDPRTVAEQLVYEIGDPQHYLTPDLDADFSQVQLAAVGENRVAVTHAGGNRRPDQLKVSIAYRDGWMASGTLVVSGGNAAVKARQCGEIILARLRADGYAFRRTNIECLGAGESLPGVWRTHNPPEVVLRLTVHSEEREAATRFTREFAPLVTAGPPGVTGYLGPRPSPWPVLAYWPALISREQVPFEVNVQSIAGWSD